MHKTQSSTITGTTFIEEIPQKSKVRQTLTMSSKKRLAFISRELWDLSSQTHGNVEYLHTQTLS
jgi:hypothetical protein